LVFSIFFICSFHSLPWSVGFLFIPLQMSLDQQSKSLLLVIKSKDWSEKLYQETGEQSWWELNYSGWQDPYA